MKYEFKENLIPVTKDIKRRIEHAKKYVFSLGVGDTAEEIGKANAIVYIAKLHFAQEKLGYSPKALFLGSPDFSFQTSPHKFQNSVPEGGKLLWGDGTYDFIPGDLEFDFCGNLVGEVSNNLSIEKIIDKLYEIKQKEYFIDDIRVNLDNFAPGNHFLNIYEVEENEKKKLPRRIAILHTSSDEMRDYLMEFVKEKGEIIDTPFGKLPVLTAKNAEKYISLCKYASDFSLKKRALLFKEIFGDQKILSNFNHYELVGTNQGVIGCYFLKDEHGIFPITFDTLLPAYLIKGKKNLSEKILMRFFRKDELEEWVYSELLKANILPHGGGTKLTLKTRLSKVIFYPEKKIFILKRGSYQKAYEDFLYFPRTYRYNEVLKRIFELDLGEKYAKLSFLFGVKVNF